MPFGWKYDKHEIITDVYDEHYGRRAIRTIYKSSKFIFTTNKEDFKRLSEIAAIHTEIELAQLGLTHRGGVQLLEGNHKRLGSGDKERDRDREPSLEED